MSSKELASDFSEEQHKNRDEKGWSTDLPFISEYWVVDDVSGDECDKTDRVWPLFYGFVFNFLEK